MSSISTLRNSIDNQISINSFVRKKLAGLPKGDISFKDLFEAMFLQSQNIMLEHSVSNRIISLSYGECKQSILKRAARLKHALSNYQSDSAVCIYMESGRDWLELFWAVLLAGFKPLLMNMRLDKGSLINAAKSAQAVAVISQNAETDFGLKAIALAEIDGCTGMAELNECGSCIIFMSSGTSEKVKLCVYNAHAFKLVIQNSYDIIKRCPAIKRHYKGRMKLLLFLPLYHIFGFVAVYTWFAFFGRTFVLLDNLMPRTILNTIRRHEVTHIFAVPMLWNKTYEQAISAIRERGEATYARFQKGIGIMKKLEALPHLYAIISKILFKEIRQNLFGSSIRFMISGGSEINPQTLEFFNAIGYHIANGYGMTEIGISSVELSMKPKLLNSGSIGLPLKSYEYKINDNSRLMVKSKSRAAEIITGSEHIKQDLDVWFDTGDLAKFDNGRYCLMGRSDDLVTAESGENLNPVIVEQALICEGIKEICLCGIKQGGALKPALIVHPEISYEQNALNELKQRLHKKLAENKLEAQVGKILFVKESLMGADDIKLNRRKVAAKIEGDQFTLLSSNTAYSDLANELKNEVRTLMAQALGKDGDVLSDTADFFTDLGGTSLDYFSLIMKLQDNYGVSFPSDAGEKYTTLEALCAYIAGKRDKL